MQLGPISFGLITIDGRAYREDIVIENGIIKPRNKEASRKYKARYGHTPLSAEENIPWDCKKLIIGNGMYGSLPVMEEVRRMAQEKNVSLVILPTNEAAKHLNDSQTNLILHLTC